jgi:alanine dehydrogenase
LTNATLPYIYDVAVHGPAGAASRDAAVALGVNTVGGRVTNGPVAEFLGVEFVAPLDAFAAAAAAEGSGARGRP